MKIDKVISTNRASNRMEVIAVDKGKDYRTLHLRKNKGKWQYQITDGDKVMYHTIGR